MWIETLRLENLRRFGQAELALAPGPNLILGPNGAGKTTLLEAAHILSYGRSFRRSSRDALTRLGEGGFRVFARLKGPAGQGHRLGLERANGRWLGRLDDAPVERLSDLFAVCAVCCFEPGSHELISGGAELRRAFLDWGLFHVEPQFLDFWRRYQRALKQRNALLRAEAPDPAFAAWDVELVRSGTALNAMRQRYVELLRPEFTAVAATLLPELGTAGLAFDPGFEAATPEAYAEQLGARLARDRVRQTTGRGPHRADWLPQYPGAPVREHLSRGQEKLTALAAVLAQARLFRHGKGEWPVVLLDDLPSELDYRHQATVLDLLFEGAQVLITGTEATPPIADRISGMRLFHVEQGQAREG